MKNPIKKFIFLVILLILVNITIYAQNISVDICPEINYNDIHFYYYEPFLTALILLNDDSFELFGLDNEYLQLRNQYKDLILEKQDELLKYSKLEFKKYLDLNKLDDRNYLLKKIESFIFKYNILENEIPRIYYYLNHPDTKDGKKYLDLIFEKGFGVSYLKLYQIFKEMCEKKGIKKFFQNYHDAFVENIQKQNIKKLANEYVKYYKIKLKWDLVIPLFFEYKKYESNTNNIMEENNNLKLVKDLSAVCSETNSIIMDINFLHKQKKYFSYVYFHEFTHVFQFLNNYFIGPEAKSKLNFSVNNNSMFIWYKYVNYLINNYNDCEFDANFSSFNFVKSTKNQYEFPLYYKDSKIEIYLHIMFYLSSLYDKYEPKEKKYKYSVENYEEGTINTEFKESIQEFLNNQIKPNFIKIIRRVKPIMDYYQLFRDPSYL